MAGKAGQLANRLVNVDAVIVDELGYLPFAESGGALLFHLICKLYLESRQRQPGEQFQSGSLGAPECLNVMTQHYWHNLSG